jgi:hypothetical protein
VLEFLSNVNRGRALSDPDFYALMKENQEILILEIVGFAQALRRALRESHRAEAWASATQSKCDSTRAS